METITTYCDGYRDGPSKSAIQLIMLLKSFEDQINDLEKKLDDPHFGLEEIKAEVAAIEGTIGGINSEVTRIEAKLANPAFGLQEIKAEVATIKNMVGDFASEISNIEDKLDNPNYGLAEIKLEVSTIENKIQSLVTEVANIEAKLDNPTYGLAVIKSEIQAIEDQLGVAGGNRSSGPFFATWKFLQFKVLNNTDQVVGPITVTAYNLDTCPKTILTAGPNDTPIQTTVFVPPGCVADLFFFEDEQGDKLNIQGSELEVQVTAPGGLPSGVLLYSRTTNTGQSGDRGRPEQLLLCEDIGAHLTSLPLGDMLTRALEPG